MGVPFLVISIKVEWEKEPAWFRRPDSLILIPVRR